MNVLLVGSGGREHALAWKIKLSPRLKKLYALPGSDAISTLAACVALDPLHFKGVADFCKQNAIDLIVVGPEAPLASGLADALKARGFCVFGPNQKCAQLESSKTFAKSFMKKHAIPTARYESFFSFDEAKAALPRFGLPVVVKADGLAGGKGVRVCATKTEAEETLQDFMVDGRLGESGRRVVIEEFLQGPETTVMGFCDGKDFLALPPSSDHKRLLDNDLGPNTGGMGVLAPTPAVTPAIFERIQKEIINRALAGLQAEKLDYRGLLYIGIMLTQAGPKVLEFNARFGDPETQAVLPLLNADLLDLMKATVAGNLEKFSQTLQSPKSSICVVLASEGYPDKPKTGREITGLLSPRETMPDVLIFHAGTKHEQGKWKTAGGRVLGVTATAATLDNARQKAYAAADRIHFEGMQYRKDIAKIKTLEKIS